MMTVLHKTLYHVDDGIKTSHEVFMSRVKFMNSKLKICHPNTEIPHWNEYEQLATQ